MEMNFKSSFHEKPAEADAEAEESLRFDKSLQELRELRCQLHNAADYCETTFSKSEEKTDVLENTKDYICRTMVTVVDHLGNVSANLEGLISQTNAFSDAELRIQCLKQRLVSCEQYARKAGLTRMQWSENVPRFHPRYLSSTPPLGSSSSKKLIRGSESQVASKIEDNHVPKAHEDLPLFMYTYKPRPAQNLTPTTATLNGHNNNLAMAVPVRDGLSVLTKVPNPTFHFQSTKKVGRHRRSFNGSDILWLIGRTKRTQ
ncbi:probable protein ABIL5 [Gastrolobium bilobum]|uniref:probable protein ABIL5 n=1 Tax=Gastrolobium bilobum TaxID=150636 RepID=UPI002AB235E1|nr:probable protein ABIL5 [Gastrolobium bilobum]